MTNMTLFKLTKKIKMYLLDRYKNSLETNMDGKYKVHPHFFPVPHIRFIVAMIRISVWIDEMALFVYTITIYSHLSHTNKSTITKVQQRQNIR
jgi:hypothetical protein